MSLIVPHQKPQAFRGPAVVLPRPSPVPRLPISPLPKNAWWPPLSGTDLWLLVLPTHPHGTVYLGTDALLHARGQVGAAVSQHHRKPHMRDTVIVHETSHLALIAT